MKDNAISESSRNKECVPEVLTPKMTGDLSWHNKTHVEREPWVKFLLEGNKGIFQQVREVHVSSSLYNIGMLLNQQPTDMREKETTCSVVRVSLGLTKLVVNTVITSPMEDGSLIGNGVTQHKEETDDEGSFVRPMRPQTMNSHGNSNTAAMQNKNESEMR